MLRRLPQTVLYFIWICPDALEFLLLTVCTFGAPGSDGAPRSGRMVAVPRRRVFYVESGLQSRSSFSVQFFAVQVASRKPLV